MTTRVIEGSQAAAHAVALCKPKVCAMYPITPSTHIPEELSKFVADGKFDTSFIRVESEFAAMSACVGASATGVRAFTATASQGVALMHEVLYAAAGMRLPIVMVVANRALSAPINIWNDHQDTIAERDSGWLQLFCETNQEVVDTIIQAYRIAEDERVLLPVMVNMDGFTLTHTYEKVDIPSQEEVDAFLPEYNPKHAYLDPERPVTQGPFAFPKPYAALRIALNEAVNNSKDVVKEIHDKYAEKFGRRYGNGLIEEYKNDRPISIVAMGSVCGTIKGVVDQRDDVGLLRVRCYRPFPKEEIKKALEGKETVIVFEKNVALGMNSGAMYSEIKDVLYELEKRPKINNVIGGLGGTDVTMQNINNFVDRLKEADGKVELLRGDPNE
ncbi:MAG: pyruvate ferredoxin oxidoreductase [Candidatus Diapherotrites archaeon]|nr:pyruvate ferredoxin oxidoreductase [Candidatus Diapherotrites archaeon]